MARSSDARRRPPRARRRRWLQALAAPLWRLLVPGLDVYDALYTRYWRTEPIGPVLSLDRRTHRGPERRFQDGTVLRPGEPIGELHLQNRRILAMHARAPHPMALALAFRRALVASLRALAARAAADPGVASLGAFHARTILTGGAPRLGFVVDAGNARPHRLRTLFFHLLMCRHHGAGLARLPRDLLPTHDLWLTGAELARRYAPAGPRTAPQRVVGGGAARRSLSVP
jgi:hypothetical protein